MSDTRKNQAQVTALRMLAASPKSRNELARKLTDKGYEGRLVFETLNALEAQGVLNDRDYARDLAARFRHDKPSGFRKIQFELKRHGIPEKIREEVLGEWNAEEEIERAREIAGLRWQRFRNLPAEKRKKKLYDFLVRRGFDFQISRDLVEALEHTEPL